MKRHDVILSKTTVFYTCPSDCLKESTRSVIEFGKILLSNCWPEEVVTQISKTYPLQDRYSVWKGK
jgi:hypothetical protein